MRDYFAAWAFILCVANFSRSYLQPDVRLGWALEGLTFGIALACIWLFFHLVSGIMRSFFYSSAFSPERHARAVGLCYYASAPLALTTIPVASFYCYANVHSLNWHGWQAVLETASFEFGWATTALIILATLIDLLIVCLTITHNGFFYLVGMSVSFVLFLDGGSGTASPLT